ncbi:MAG: SUMF1/EgtB/PvdO family nonheme iron enzyme [Planctomycetes bacterium]|nr:SUMF1/EgtB/PvdO family nonheme iron enzyme [Planctomycetota bacterium]
MVASFRARFSRAVLACTIAGAIALPSHAQAASAPSAPENHRLVMCWYMVCFGNSVEVYKQEIALAQRHGIDGFLLDVGEWGVPPSPSRYVESAERMYEAAKQLGSGFKLAMAPEYSVVPMVPSLQDMLKRFHGHPNQLRHGGKDVLSSYGIPGGVLTEVKQSMSAEGIETFIVPHMFPPKFEYLHTPERVASWFAEAPAIDGMMSFDAKPVPEILRQNATTAAICRAKGKLFAAGVIPAYNSANLEDYRGLSGYAAMWEGAIRDRADWISLVIWNDYNEDSALMPYRWPGGQEKDYFDRDESFLVATAYNSRWYKTGVRPRIDQDQVFMTYRNRGKWLRQAWDAKADAWVDLCAKAWPFDQIHDNVEDNIYLDAYLTAPATLTLTVGATTKTFEMPAGVGHAEAPLVPGLPRLALSRMVDGKAKVLADIVGRKTIIGTPTKENSPYGTSQHLSYRTWASGTAVGAAQRLEAEAGTVLGDAVVAKVGAVSAIQTKATDGSGFQIALKGLKTGTYNVRISYCNPDANDARLTLSADGPPRSAHDHPYFIPAFLPSTGKDTFATVSFLWSLYDTTTMMKIAWEPGKVWGQPDATMDDRGAVLIDAIELIAVQPFADGTPSGSPATAAPESITLVTIPAATPGTGKPPVPALVAIPGGRFAMGSDKGEPDELPVRQVTISPFAIGTCEVTNEEFERFDPKHREHRTSVSSGDRDPVIAVSWNDATAYCNWLSQQHGLAPAFVEVTGANGEKRLEADLKAAGFRLPTEAEWEYVASGRGEGRAYPWGADLPTPMKQGNFQGRRALDFTKPAKLAELPRTMPVGSFPAGASRDGVMDLAGNVGEWCCDWYDPYVAGDATDPRGDKPGNYRSIRGGTWGWYGWSQRCTDREFNNAGYPGHCYYGFRLAISETGAKQVGVKR